MSTKTRHILLGGLLLLVTLVAYEPVRHCGYIWDDDSYVTQNETLRSVEGLKRMWLEPRSIPQYYPMVHTSYWVEYHLWELEPLGYHLVNVLLHVGGALLLWRIGAALGIPASWWIAAVFAVHPVHVESVAWITERKNVLSGVFYLASLWAWIRFFQLAGSRKQGADSQRSGDNDDRDSAAVASAAGSVLLPSDYGTRWGWYVIGLVFFVAALLSKTVTATLPAVVLLLVYWRYGRVSLKQALWLTPLFIVGMGMGLLTVWLEKHHVGAEGVYWQLSGVERLCLAGRSAWFYIGKLLWPTGLTFNYTRWQMDDGKPGQYLYPLAMLLLLGILWRGRQWIGRGPLVAMLFFLVSLFPALGFFDVYPFAYSYVADHFQYLASIGIIVLVTGGGGVLLQRVAPGRSLRTAGWLVGVAIVILLTVRTRAQCPIYDNEETLWRHTISVNPDSWLANAHLGTHYRQLGEYPQAEQYYRRAITVNPHFGGGHNNLGLVLRQQGRLDEAIESYRAALAIDATNADYHSNLANALLLAGKPSNALPHYQSVYDAGYDDETIILGLARCHTMLANPSEAIAFYRRGIELGYDRPLVWRELLGLYRQQGDQSGIIESLEALLRHQPSDVGMVNNLAWELATASRESFRRPEQALRLARTACKATNHQRPDMLDTLAAAQAAMGEYQHAAQTARQAVSLARDMGLDLLARDIQERVHLYESGRPYAQSHGTAP